MGDLEWHKTSFTATKKKKKKKKKKNTYFAHGDFVAAFVLLRSTG